MARGEIEADLVLKNGQIVNVFSGEVYTGDVAIYHTRIVGIGGYRAKKVIDVEGEFIAPGFIDGHVHIESAMVRLSEFARAVVPLGTTTVVIDPHEIANVLGMDGIRYMLESAKYLPLSVYIMLSSCVPTTHMETTGAHLSGEDLSPFLNLKWVLGLGEVMNFPGVIGRDQGVLDKIRMAGERRIDGHAPGLSGKDLVAYVAAGVRSDHESTTAQEAREKLRAGMYVMLREGTTARNLDALLPLVNSDNVSRLIFCTDDRHPLDLLTEGHINSMIKRAIEKGIDPITAIKMATINPTEYFGINDIGAIIPGYRADLVTFDNFENLRINRVIKGGKVVAEGGQLLPLEKSPPQVHIRSSINVHWMELKDFSILAEDERVKIINIIPNQLTSQKLIERPKVVAGQVVSDTDRDILKAAVVERHLASGNVGKGFVKGFGLKRGAIASSVAHDSHNIVVVGVTDDDMLRAVIEIIKLRGGMVTVVDGKVKASLALPIAGLMSEEPLEEVSSKLEELRKAAGELGCTLKDPFMQLSFLALTVIPELRLTDKGLVDVKQFKLVPLFGE